MRRSIDPMCVFRLTGSRPKPASRTIVSMSLRPAIPWRVGLHQSPPPLHQPMTILAEMRYFEKKNSLNGKCRNSVLSQPKGSPHCRRAPATDCNRLQQFATPAASDDGSQATKNPVVEHKRWDALLGFWGGLLLLRLWFWRDAFRWTCIPVGMRLRFYELFCPT